MESQEHLTEPTVQRVKHFPHPVYQYVAKDSLKLMYRLFSLESVAYSLNSRFEENIFTCDINCNFHCIFLFKLLEVIGKYVSKNEKNDY